jgi:chemotaxis protein CheC
VHRATGEGRIVQFRDETLELIDLRPLLAGERETDAACASAVVVWAAGRRRAFGVCGLVGQQVAERHELPAAACGEFVSGVLLVGEEIVPIIEPGALAGGWTADGTTTLGFDELQQSALKEVANIGSGHAATALSQLLGRPVDISYSEAMLTVLAEAIDKVGAPMGRSALVDTPLRGGGGTVLLVFPDDAGEQLCQLLGTTLEDEMGRTALQEVGNILAASYLNAIVEMTGMDLEPDPPSVEVDMLGQLLSRSAAAGGRPDDPTVLMRSELTVESSTARFSFLFVPQIGSVHTLLDKLGVGTPQPVAVH